VFLELRGDLGIFNGFHGFSGKKLLLVLKLVDLNALSDFVKWVERKLNFIGLNLSLRIFFVIFDLKF
jgi:hypothetical protein